MAAGVIELERDSTVSRHLTRIELDLSQAQQDRELRIFANYVRFHVVPTRLLVRLNAPDAVQFPITEAGNLHFPGLRIESLYITTQAAQGTLVLLVSDSPFDAHFADPQASEGIDAGVVAVGALTQLPDRYCRELIVQASPSNTQDILLGTQAAQSIELPPGTPFGAELRNLGLLWARSRDGSAQQLNWLVRF